MMKPSVEVRTDEHALLAEFWECLRLDPAPVKELRNHFEAHLRSGGRPFLVVDLLGVQFALSTALGHFIGLQKVARQGGGEIIFCNVDPMVREVLRISKLESMFRFADDRPAALALAARLDAARVAGEPAPAVNESTGPRSPGPGRDRDSAGDGLLRRHRRRML